MAADWPTISLRDAGVDLIDCEHKTPPAASTGYPYVAIPQLHQGRLLLKEARRISKEHLVEWTRRAKPQQHDVILSRRCNPGETAVVPEGVECAVGQNLVLLRANGRHVYPPFLRWLVRGPAWWDQISKFLNVGAVFDSLRCADVPRFELPIPPIDDQCAIAHILGTIDDKMELNRRTSETLDAMARALFKSWFVDFDPVRTKAAGKQPAGMDAATAALFPSEFVDSEIGEIPKGWSFRALDEIADFKNGLALQKYRPNSHEPRLPVVKIADLRTGNANHEEWSRADIDPACVLDDGDIIFSWSGSLTVVVWCGGRAALNQHLFRVTPAAYPKSFLLGWLLRHLPGFQQIAADKATTMGHIQRHHLTAATCLVPTPQVLARFGDIADELLRRRVNAEQASRSLAKVRDALLPRLLSGELPIPNAGRIVEAAT